MKENKFKPGKGFYLWLMVGLFIYTAFAGGYTLLTNENQKTASISSLLRNSEQISCSGRTLTTTGSDSKLYFTANTAYNVNYIDIYVSNPSEPNIGAKLYYADKENGFSEGRATAFYLVEGYNEIKVKGDEYLRLDISDRADVSLTLDKIVLRAAANPIYAIPQSLIFFMIFWFMLYFAAAWFGVHYTSLRGGITVLLESIFAGFLVTVMLFSLGRISCRLIICALTPLTAFSLAIIYPRIRLEKIKTKIFVPAVLIVMTGIMCIVGWKMLSAIQTDLAAVYYSAWEIAENGRVNTVCTGKEPYRWFFEASNNDYFVRYHTNLPILAILGLFYKALSAFGLTAQDILSNYMSVLLNIAFIMAGVIFGMLAAKNLFGKKGGLIYLIMSALFVPLYINACRFYTDTISMPFVPLALWLYSVDDSRFKSPYIKYVLIGFAIGVGALIKGSIMVVPVALLIQLTLKAVKNIRFAMVTILVMVALSGAWGVYTKNCSWIDMSNNDALEFPLTHWVMMGFNRDVNGGYSQEDMEYTNKYTTKAKKQKANIRIIKYRLGSFSSLSDFGEYEFSRAADTWCDGQYMQDNHIDWGLEKGKIYDVLTEGRAFYACYKVYIQIFSYCMYIFAVAGAFLSLKRPKAAYGMFLRLTMLGVMLFFMLWESKSRYIFNFTPVFMLAAIYGAEEIKNRKILINSSIKINLGKH